MRERIKLTDSTPGAVVKLAEGNPGAVVVCVELLKQTPVVDPDSALGGLGSLLSLDSLGLYGSDIWLLYKDICGEDIAKMIAMLRARQLGFLSKQQLVGAIKAAGAREDTGLDVESLLKQVQEKLPRFGAEGDGS